MTFRRIPVSGIVGLLVLAGVLFTPRALAAGLSVLPGFGSYLAAGLNYLGGVTVYTAPARQQPAAAALAKDPAPGVREAAARGAVAIAAPATTRVVYEYLPATTTPAVTVTTSGVTEAELDRKLAALQAAIKGEIKNVVGAPPLTSSGILQGFAMTNAAVGESTGATLHNVTLDSVSGLSGSDLPDLSGTYLSLSKGGTVSGNLTVTGAFTGGTLSLTNASTSALTVAGPASFGGTATSTFGTDGSLTLAGLGAWGAGFLSQGSSTIAGDLTTTGMNSFAGALTVTGDTALANASTTSLFTGGTASASSAAFGATATSSFSTAGALTLASALTVGNGGTGASSFGQGWLYSSGDTGALAASTSPTVNYVTATSTTATSTFAGGLTVAGSSGLAVLQNGDVGIGTTSPVYPLDINGVARGQFYDDGGATYNVKAFGAKGDGVTDDSSAVLAAIQAASDAGGGTVFFPPGTYIM